MHYLGGLTGSGMLTCDGKEIARISYDFDCFLQRSSEVVGSGEISFAARSLNDVFGQDVQIRNDDGRILKLKFSEKTLHPRAGVAHVDVCGGLPAFAQHWLRSEQGPH